MERQKPHPFIYFYAAFIDLFLFFASAPQIIQVVFHELLAFDLFLFATFSLRISFLKIRQESHLYHKGQRKCN